MAGPRQGKRSEGAGKGARILIVEARFYDEIADALLAGAMKALKEASAEVDRISVPGSLEIPAAIAIAADAAHWGRQPYDGAVALGCVIRGETIHFEIVSHQSARGLMELSVAQPFPSAMASSPSTPKRRPGRAPAWRSRTRAAMPRARRWR